MTLPSDGAHDARDDKRLAIEWEGHCEGRLFGTRRLPDDSDCTGPIVGAQADGRPLERLTRRSIDRDIDALTEELHTMRSTQVRLVTAGAAPVWWSDRSRGYEKDRRTQLPLPIENLLLPPGHPAAAVSNPQAMNRILHEAIALGEWATVGQSAQSSLLWRELVPSPAISAEGRVLIPEDLQRAQVEESDAEAADILRRAHRPRVGRVGLGQYAEQALLQTLRAHQYGPDEAAAPPAADAGIFDVVAGLFGGDDESESEGPWTGTIESPLVQQARQNFAWLYYDYIINQRMNMDQARTFTEQSLDAAADEIFIGTGFSTAAAYFKTFADLIVRARAHQIILDFEAELEVLEGEEDDDQYFDDEGNYLPAAQSRQTQENIDRLMRDRYGDPPEQPEDSRIKRLAEQCFLVDHLPQLAETGMKRSPSGGGPPGINYTTFTPIHGATQTIINKLIYNPQLRYMDQLTPAEMSSLVPKIRIYKVFFNEDRTETYEQEVPFENYVGPDEISQMTNASHERGQGAGIISFDWTLDGQNPFAARRFIHAKMKLFFQSFKVFLKEFRLPAVGSGGNSSQQGIRSFRYVDLVNTGMVANAPTSLGWNPDYFKLKIEVGWTASDMDVFTGTPATIQGKKEAIKAAKMVMFATATEHDIDVNDEGNVTLTIDYTSWQEASYSQGDSDILATDPIRRLRQQHRAEIERLLDSEGDPCSDELIEKLEEIKTAYQQGAHAANYDGWQRLLNSLSEQRSPSKIYVARVSISDMNKYYDAERAGTPTAGIEALLGPLPATTSSSLVVDVAPDGVVDAAADAIASPATDAPLLENLENLTWDEDDEYVNVQFFYFGDLVEAAFKLAFGDGEGAGEKLQKKLRILMGPISLRLRNASESDPGDEIWDDINLADIPISVHFFIEWFLKDVIGQNRMIYPAMNFVQNVLTTLIRPLITRQCKDLQNIPRQQLQLRTNFFSAAGNPKSDTDPVSALKNMLNRTRVDVDHAFDQAQPLVRAARLGAPAYHYMVMYAISSPTRSLRGNPRDDSDRGIYHFGIGKNAGLLKSVKFSKADFNLREARIERELLSQATGLAILANVYSVKIKTFGNTLFVPGSRLYINPSGILSLGSEESSASAARMLGIGGYHTVYNVRSYIESGKYETEIDALWESSGGDEGFASLRDLSDIAACTRRVRRLTNLPGLERTAPPNPGETEE